MAATDELPLDERFGAGHLFLADSRLALLIGNYLRRRSLMRAFGVTEQQVDLLTAVIVLTAAGASIDAARKVAKAPVTFTRANGTMAGLLLREGVFAIAGPGSRAVPALPGLVGLAVAGGLLVPTLRRVARGVRMAERRERLLRIRRYEEAERHMHAPTASPD